MKTLFNTMTCSEPAKLSLFHWPDGSDIFRAGGLDPTSEADRCGGSLCPGPALHPAPAQNLPLAVNRIPGQRRKVKKIKTQTTKPETPHLGWKNQYISSGKGEKYSGCESAARFRIPAKTGAKKQNHILLVSVSALRQKVRGVGVGVVRKGGDGGRNVFFISQCIIYKQH